MADKNEREFSEEQLRAHEGHIGLQAGFNKGASQAGVGSFGNTRHMWNLYLIFSIQQKKKHFFFNFKNFPPNFFFI